VLAGDQPTLLVESNFHRLYRSADGGDSWTSIGPAVPDDSGYRVNLVPGPAGTLYAQTRGGVFRSMDAGMTWTRSDTGLPPASPVTSIVAEPGNRREPGDRRGGNEGARR